MAKDIKHENVYHGHRVVGTMSDKGMSYELFAPTVDGVPGESLGLCETLAEAIAEAKRRFKVAEKLKEDGEVDEDEEDDE